MTKDPTSKTYPITQQLVRLGLTSDEANSYITLVNKGSLTSAQIAKRIGVLPNALYRLMKKLQEKGFVRILNTYPVTFQAFPPATAIDSFVTQKIREFENMKLMSVESLSESQATISTKVDVLISQEVYFKKFVELANSAKSEILVISIGEPVPDEIKIACARALERGVKIRFVFHIHNKENDSLLKAWVKMGSEVRYYKDSGYHLNLFDGKTAVLVANNPENTKERTGMIFYNERLTHSLREYFHTLWDRSIPISP